MTRGQSLKPSTTDKRIDHAHYSSIINREADTCHDDRCQHIKQGKSSSAGPIYISDAELVNTESDIMMITKLEMFPSKFLLIILCPFFWPDDLFKMVS